MEPRARHAALARHGDANREMMIQRWGEPGYRLFRLYLWGCVDGFKRGMLDAVRLVRSRMERTPAPWSATRNAAAA